MGYWIGNSSKNSDYRSGSPPSSSPASSSSSSKSSSSSSSSSSSGSSSGSSSSSSSGQSQASWWQSNFGYVPSWVAPSALTPAPAPAPAPAPTPTPAPRPASTSTPAPAPTPKPPAAPATPTWQQQLESYKTNSTAGLAEIARAGDVYNTKIAAGDKAGADAAHTWANQIRDTMGVSSQYDRTSGAYIGSGSSPSSPVSKPTNTTSISTPPSATPTAPVLGNQTNTPASLVPNSQQFQQGAYNFNSNAKTVAVDLGNGQNVNGVMKDGYTYVPIRQVANMMGGQIGQYDSQNLTIEVNGVAVPVHIDANGVGYTPVRNMANAFGTNVGWENSPSGVSKVYFENTKPAVEPPPVVDEELIRQQEELDKRQQMIEELIKQFQQPLQMPQIPNMPEMPSQQQQQQQASYESFLERAREMINPAYAKARETLSRVNQQQRQLMLQRLAAKGQPHGGLREEMEMDLSRNFMGELSKQDMEQLAESMKIAQSLSQQDEDQARWLADEAWKRWQAQANMAQQQYQYAASDRNNRLSGLMNMAKYLQDEEQAKQQATINERKFALEQGRFNLDQDKFAWDKDKYLLPSGDTVFKYENISEVDKAKMNLDWLQHQTPSGNALTSAQSSLQAAAMRASSSNDRPRESDLNNDAQGVANGYYDTMLAYTDWNSMYDDLNRYVSVNQVDGRVATAMRQLANQVKPFYFKDSNEMGRNIKIPTQGINYGKMGGFFGNTNQAFGGEDNDYLKEMTEVGDGTFLQAQTPWWKKVFGGGRSIEDYGDY